MASGKERARWERWYDQISDRMERQKVSITRLTLLLTEATAALTEIQAMGADAGITGKGGEGTSVASERAESALDYLAEPAAATLRAAGELVEEENPEDPRRGA